MDSSVVVELIHKRIPEIKKVGSTKAGATRPLRNLKEIKYMGTKELSQRTGVPGSTINLWVTQGLLIPRVTGYGTGSRHEFSEDNVVQALAIKRVREEFGDGTAARRYIAEAVPQAKVGTQYLDIPRFELALT